MSAGNFQRLEIHKTRVGVVTVARLACTAFTLCLLAVCSFAQGNFIYDQESSTENGVLEGGASLSLQPMGQSFTPLLNAVGFIRLDFQGGGGTASFHIVLHNDSITGPILGTSDSKTLSSVGFADFFFNQPAAVTPGTTYYFQPIFEGALVVGG